MTARTKIAVVGYTQHRQLAPWTNPDWEIWALNDLYMDLGIFSDEAFDLTRLQWFQLHPWAAIRNWDKEIKPGDQINPGIGPMARRDPNHMLWMREASKHFPVYLKQLQDECPDCLAYPYDDVYKYFGEYYTANDRFKYFTNSITFMMAKAIMQLCPDPKGQPVEGAHLAVYGVDMQVAGSEGNSEYGYQRPSCEWAAGYCMGKGIQFTVPDESDLCKSAFVYGDEEEFYFRKRLAAKKNEVEMVRIQAVNQREQSRFQEGIQIGAKSMLEWLERSHLPGDDGIGQAPIAHGQKIPMG